MKEIYNLKTLTKQELKEAVGYVEGKYILDNEDTHEKADSLAYWEQIKEAKLENSYLANIRKVTKEDILKAAKKYLTKNYTMAVIEQIT